MINSKLHFLLKPQTLNLISLEVDLRGVNAGERTLAAISYLVNYVFDRIAPDL